MINKAKCLNCHDIIVASGPETHVQCKCGEISITHGKGHVTKHANSIFNFMELIDEEETANDDVKCDKAKEENQCPNKVKDKIEDSGVRKPLTKQELTDMLRAQARNIENLPPHVMCQPITHYDFYTLIMSLLSFFSSD